MLDQLLKDFRYSVRLLLKVPIFSATAVLSIALGIGANAIVFSAINGLLLKSLPYNTPERIVVVWGTNRDNGSLSVRDQVSATDIADLRKQNNVFEDVTTFTGWMPILSGFGVAERVPAIQVGDGYFKIMKAKPLLGRVFLPEEQQDGKDFEVVLSYALWQSRF